jgi:hypothetical protein
MILFDLRNKFYHLGVLFEYARDIAKGLNHSNLSYYHLLFLWPALAILGGYMLGKASKSNRILVFIFVLVYVYMNLTSTRYSFNFPVGMPKGLVQKDILRASDVIARDNPVNFNVAVLLDFDTRGHILRYPLEFLFNSKPNQVEEYPNSKTLYVLSKDDYEFENSSVWELATFKDNPAEKLTVVGQGYAIYKFVK